MDMNIKPNSLASRYFFAAAVVLPILLGFSAYSLDKAFKKSLVNAEKDALKAQIYLLLGSAEPTATSLTLPTDFTEPRFSSAESGLYAFVHSNGQPPIWKSTSYSLTQALNQQSENRNPHHIKNLDLVPHIDMEEAGVFYFSEVSWLGEKVFQLQYKTIWEFDSGEQSFDFVILHTQSAFQKELKNYRNAMWTWVGGMSILLLFSQLLIVRWSLVPLKHLARDIDQLDKGKTNQLTREYPNEIKPVTLNLNRVLAVEQQQRSKYKNTLSDLAHSLKTPLAIMQGVVDSSNSKPEGSSVITLGEQIQRMSDIIGHQLKRATFSSHALVQDKINIHQLFERLNSALQKVYREKQIEFQNHLLPDALIAGEEGDLMEVFGNILENAFKYGHRRVSVCLSVSTTGYDINIEDDGPGIHSNLKQDILKRGARADTVTSGQGIGLAVAVEIISSYNGALRTEDSALGGAKFTISLPKP